VKVKNGCATNGNHRQEGTECGNEARGHRRAARKRKLRKKILGCRKEGASESDKNGTLKKSGSGDPEETLVLRS